MRKGEIELLAPAGSYEALVAAVQAGANAVYVGGLQFGARAFANNFDNTTMKKAVDYCHLRNVFLYVTVNTLYSDDQFNELIEYVTFLYEIGVDALIIQDMGLFHIIKKNYPDIEIHISTQASIRNIEGVKYFEKQNIDRVVLAREMNIKEIYEIGHHCDIDLEVFVHGALCMSYSGQCLMSSMIAKRSGNKGKCGQPCRLPYELLEDGKVVTKEDKYLLSPRDLCTIEHIGELIDAGVKSFKIEGRMKRPEYVFTVVKSYRNAIDAYMLQQKTNNNEAILNMKKMFNRGFTNGFLKNESLSLSKSIPGHQGIYLGSISHFNKKNHLLYFNLDNDLYQNDRIYFPKNDLTRTITKLYKNGKLVNFAKKGESVAIELNSKIDMHQQLYKVIDINLINEVNQSLKKENIHIPIDMILTGDINKSVELTIICKNQKIKVYSDTLVEQAIKIPLTKERIYQQLNKLGNTIYIINNINISFPDNATISIKSLNDLRRIGISLLNEKRLQHNRKRPQFNIETTDRKKRHKKGIAIKVTSLTQLENVDLSNIEQIFIPFYEYTSYQEKYIPYIPFLYDEDDLIKFMKTSVFMKIDTVMVSDFGAYHLLNRDKNVILNYNFNISNSFALLEFDKNCVLSMEMSKKQINQLKGDHILYMTSYSKNINMNLKHCIISDHYFGYKNKKCSLCQMHTYQLNDRKNEKFDIITDRYCNNYILNNRTLFIDKIDDLNVDFLLLDFTNENSSFINKIITDFQMNVLYNEKSEIAQSLDTFRGYYL